MHDRVQGSVEEHSARLTSPEAGSLRRMDLDTPRPVPMLWGHYNGVLHIANAAEGCLCTAESRFTDKVCEGQVASQAGYGEHPASPPFSVNSCGWLSVAASFLPSHVFWVQIFPSLKDTVTMD